MHERLIFHVDVNSAFLSWEAVRRVKEGLPDLRDIPSAIGGDRDTRTGVILAKSVPAKRFGVQTGEPVGLALRKCPTLVLAKPDFRLYTEQSDAFMEVCRRYAPVVERYSIDECFLDMTGTERLYPDPVLTARHIADEIRDTLGFTVNVGVGSNKLLAKIAGDFEKPDKVHTLFSTEIAQKLWPLPVEAMLGVGKATAEKLRAHCWHTVGDLARIEEAVLAATVGKKAAAYLHRAAWGQDDSPVSDQPEQAKGYSVATTSEADIVGYEAADKTLLLLTDSVTTRLRADGAKAGCVAVQLRTTAFENRSHQRKLTAPTDITRQLYATAKELIREAWDGQTPLRLLGVALSDVSQDAHEQLSLFEEETAQNDKSRALDRTVDELRQRFGMDGVVRGTALGAQKDVGKKYKAQAEQQQKERSTR